MVIYLTAIRYGNLNFVIGCKNNVKSDISFTVKVLIFSHFLSPYTVLNHIEYSTSISLPSYS